MAMQIKSKTLCEGCRNDFYNQPGNAPGGECWLFQKAKVATRWRLPWWTAPTESGAFTKVRTLDCHTEPGRFAFYETLPKFAVDPQGVRE
mgnify:CR=1 FL=1